MEASIRSVFAMHFEAWSEGRRMPLHHRKAGFALGHCRTTAMGTHVQVCERGDYAMVLPNACRSRSCPRCASLARERWVRSQQAKLLACDHYHVVFTLPHELLGLFASHRRLMVDTLFQSVRETLMTLLEDRRHLGAEPGVLMALHTWGRNLSHHPHLHCLVTGGGITADQQWRSTKTSYLLPVRLVKALYRGKFLGLLRDAVVQGRLCPVPGLTMEDLRRLFAALREREWQVRLKERYAHGQGVMKYLARYVKGGPLADRRVVHVDQASVTFRYRDHRDGQHKRMTLSAGDFIGRLLWHLPEPSQHLVRAAGLYANRAADKRRICREQLRQSPAVAPSRLSWQDYLSQRGYAQKSICPICGGRLLVPARARRNRNSYSRRRATAVSVQPVDGVYIACVPQRP